MKIQPEKIAQGIDRLNSINISDPDAYDQVIAGFRHMGKLPSLVVDHPNLPIQMFRTRTHLTNNLWENFSDIGLPPGQAVLRFARCNKPGQPAFYCSENRPTSYMELLEYWVSEKKEEKLYVTISGWEISNKLTMAIITSPNPADRLSKFDKDHGKAYDYQLPAFDADERAGVNMFFKFMFDKFRKPAKNDLHTYLITTGYCDLIFNYPNSPVDAMFYPSVPFNGNGINLAIRDSYDFSGNVRLNLVARNTFQRLEENSTPVFKEIEIIHAKQLDHANGKILW